MPLYLHLGAQGSSATCVGSTCLRGKSIKNTNSTVLTKEMQVETRQDEPSGWCFRRDVDSSFSLMIPFLAWETLNYELKPSILFSKTTLFAAKFVPFHDVCACLSNFLPFFVCAFLSLLMSFEMIELDASHWTHDETLYGLDAPGDDAEGDRH